MTVGWDEFESRFGRQLYELLPAVYRERDNTERRRGNVVKLGDLARYLDSFGLLLDRLRSTLDQRLADAFPDNSGGGPACQDWLVPYFARLLDVTLVAPNLRGQRDEVFNAVRWRQGKGALPAVEEIGEAVLESEVELQEGWRRVALTPRVGAPLLPPSVFGVMRTLDARWPSEVTRHPGLPAATLDLRCRSLAVQTQVVSPAVKTSRLAGGPYRWRQSNHHGVPEGPGSFDDVSRRTVDLRATPTTKAGHAHPRRLLAFTPIPRGLLPPPSITLTWAQARSSPRVAFRFEPDTRELIVQNLSSWPLVISDDVELPADTNAQTFILSDLRVLGRVRVAAGRLQLRRVVASEVVVETAFFDPAAPVLDASDCLLGRVSARHGYARLQRTTLRRAAHLGAVVARDCLFCDELSDGAGHRPSSGSLSYCGVPDELAALPLPPGAADLPLEIDESCTSEQPRLFASPADDPTQPITEDAAVLRPDCPAAVAFGAADGKELGVYNAGRKRPVVVGLAQSITLPAGDQRSLTDLVFASSLRVAAGAATSESPRLPLRLERVAARELRVGAEPSETTGELAVVLQARSCLFGSLEIAPGVAQLEYCTVLGAGHFAHLQASDCIFGGPLTFAGEAGRPTKEDCLRYSRLPASLLALAGGSSGLHFPACTAERPVYHEHDFARALAGTPGLGVLDPTAPKELRSGAEDGGELGAFHDARICLSRDAVTQKLVEHLPVGVEPVLIPDARLDVVVSVAREP